MIKYPTFQYKRIAFLLLLNSFTLKAYSQIWTAGDVTGFYLNPFEQEFTTASTVTFDIDCDGVADIRIRSNYPDFTTFPPGWQSLYIDCTMQENNENKVKLHGSNSDPSIFNVFGF